MLIGIGTIIADEIFAKFKHLNQLSTLASNFWLPCKLRIQLSVLYLRKIKVLLKIFALAHIVEELKGVFFAQVEKKMVGLLGLVGRFTVKELININ